MKLRPLREFWRDQEGIASVELMLSVPILVWALLSTHVYFDAFRAESLSTRAGLTIADMYSRRDVVNDDYVTGSYRLFNVLTGHKMSGPGNVRVTSFEFLNGENRTPSDDSVRVIWSKVGDVGLVPHTTSSLNNLIDRIPIMDNHQQAILVETSTTYTAPFSIGLGPFMETNLDDVEFDTFTVIRPRFHSQLCFEDSDENTTCY
ncbi:hypothetical protein TW80_02465 [Loktanella sp. S4079]|nr:hypothetical protein TW80_02465 [Loktanella sp. S4079]